LLADTAVCCHTFDISTARVKAVKNAGTCVWVRKVKNACMLKLVDLSSEKIWLRANTVMEQFDLS